MVSLLPSHLYTDTVTDPVSARNQAKDYAANDATTHCREYQKVEIYEYAHYRFPKECSV